MENTIKKSRKAIKNYTFNSSEGEVEIDLNNFTAVCTETGNEKKFYHSYLANLIVTKYDNNITTFTTTYVSREGKKGQNETKKLDNVKLRIEKLYNQIRELKKVRDELQSSESVN
jgi:hypothetical protein